MRQDTAAIHINLIPNRHIIAQHAHVLQSRPFANGAIPAYNRTLHPGMIFDLAASQQDTSLQPHSVTHHDIWANGNVRTYAAVLPDLGRRVDEDVPAVDETFGGGGEEFGVFFGERGEVETCAA